MMTTIPEAGQTENVDEEIPVKITSESQKLNVDGTIQQLANLAQECLGNGITKDQAGDLNSVAENVSQLENECKDLHDALEIATISGSKQRHALQILPGRYRKEMEDAVVGARQLNEEEMRRLGAKLAEDREKKRELDESLSELTKENVRLEPECARVRKSHDQIIAHLNQRMSEKAKKQILLNETRDALRDVNGMVREIDVGIENVIDDLNKDREKFQLAKSELLRKKSEMEARIERQKQTNLEDKRAADKVQAKVMEMSGLIDDEQKVIRRIEQATTRLQLQTIQLQDKIERERRGNSDLRLNKATLEGAKERQQQEFEEKIKEKEAKQSKLDVQLHVVRGAVPELTHRKLKVEQKSDDVTQKKSRLLMVAKQTHLTVSSLKLKKNTTLENIATLKKANEVVEGKIATLRENHAATTETYNAQIEEYTEMLHSEKQARAKVTNAQDESEKVLDTFRTEQMHFMNDMSQKIEEQRQRYALLADRSVALSRDTKTNRTRADSLEVKLEVANSSFRTMKAALEMEIERLKSSKEFLEADNARKEAYVAQKKLDVAQLLTDIESMTVDYNREKEEVVAIRNQEKSAQEKITRMRSMIERVNNPIKALKKELESTGEKGVEQLRNHADEQTEIVRVLYNMTAQREYVFTQNKKIELYRRALMTEIGGLVKDFDAHDSHQHWLHRKLQAVQTEFADAHEVCTAMEHASALQDEKILKGITRVQKAAKQRAEELSGVGSTMHRELNSLASFVDDVAERRPRDTRRGKRWQKAADKEKWRRASSSFRPDNPSSTTPLPSSGLHVNDVALIRGGESRGSRRRRRLDRASPMRAAAAR